MPQADFDHRLPHLSVCLSGSACSTFANRAPQHHRPTPPKHRCRLLAGLFPDNRRANGTSSVVLESWSGDQLLPTGLFHRTAPEASLAGFLRVMPFHVSNSPLGGVLTWTSGTNSALNFDIVSAVWTNRPGTNAISGDTNMVSCLLKIPGIPDQSVVWGADNRPRFNQTNGISFRADATKGVFSGSASRVENGRKVVVPFRGVLFSSVPPGMDSGLRGAGLASFHPTSAPVPVKLVLP
jgi:hypothetical protein